MNNTINFIKENLQNAYAVNAEYGINYVAVLAQAAVETGWGQHVMQNNYFGIKGSGQVVRTREVLDSPDLAHKFVRCYSIESNGDGTWSYIVDDYFRGYKSAYESFMDYGKFIHDNSRY